MCVLTYPDNPLPGTFPVPCPACGGDRGHEGPFCHVDYRNGSAWGDWYAFCHVDYRNGSAWGDWYECTYCRGTGSVGEDCLPPEIDGDELDDYRADAPIEEPAP